MTKAKFTRDEWNNLLHLLNISHFNTTCCAKNSSMISCSTMAKRSQNQKEEKVLSSRFSQGVVILGVDILLGKPCPLSCNGTGGRWKGHPVILTINGCSQGTSSLLIKGTVNKVENQLRHVSLFRSSSCFFRCITFLLELASWFRRWYLRSKQYIPLGARLSTMISPWFPRKREQRPDTFPATISCWSEHPPHGSFLRDSKRVVFHRLRNEGTFSQPQTC